MNFIREKQFCKELLSNYYFETKQYLVMISYSCFDRIPSLEPSFKLGGWHFGSEAPEKTGKVRRACRLG